MIDRYADKEITDIWSKENKVKTWQEVELAIIEARFAFGEISKKDFLEIKEKLKRNPIDINWWLSKENELKHDLNAFVEERRRFLSSRLQIYFHKSVTSYDIEEPAFAIMLQDSLEVVERFLNEFVEVLRNMAERYRYTVMNARTHGQEAELQSFGKRILCYISDMKLSLKALRLAEENLRYSKISGAIGNYGGGITPHLEKEALKILDLKPYYGATQIMPREIYMPVADTLCHLVGTLEKISISIRLGARSGRRILQEPFGKKQTGSSAMPHKKNSISTEQIEGMWRMATNYLNMIIQNIPTWEERAIEQSCVERVAWPDLFHITVHSLKTMTKVMSGLVVYQDTMLLEIFESRGTYASNSAKELLKELRGFCQITVEECYRIVQLAAFNVLKPSEEAEEIRNRQPKSLEETNKMLSDFVAIPVVKPISIQQVIANGELKVSPELAATAEDVARWNTFLKIIFRDQEAQNRWKEIFTPSYHLKAEQKLYAEILSDNKNP
jgi:adenylosuccinate lyase